MKFKKIISALLSLTMSAGLTTDVLNTSFIDSKAETEKTELTAGDVNGNGIVDAIDASAVLTYYALTSTGKDGGFTEAQLKAADMNQNGIVDANDASSILVLYAKNSVGNGGSSGTVKLGRFKANVWDIYINEKETVTFTIDVTSDEKLAEKALALYDDSDTLVTYMNDDGKNGDVKADDGVYSAELTLSSAETKYTDYYAAVGDNKSNTRRVSFYRLLTEDDFKGFAELNEAMKDLSFEEVCEYVSNSDKIKTYEIYEKEQSVCFQTIYGFHSCWQPPIDENAEYPTCGTGQYAIPDSTIQGMIGNDLINRDVPFQTLFTDMASTLIDEYEFTPANHKHHNVAVLKQTKEPRFGDYCENLGDCIVQATNQNSPMFSSKEEIREKQLKIIDPAECNTLEELKHLDGYGTVIMDAHGAFYNKMPYITTGIKIPDSAVLAYMNEVLIYLANNKYEMSEFSKDIFSGNISSNICFSEYMVGPGFFDKYYEDNSLEDSLWLLGDCHSMQSDDLANVIRSKGATAVIGFSNSVSFLYRDELFFEILINSMLFSADSLKGGIAEAEKLFGKYDPLHVDDGIKTHLRMIGDDYHYVTDVKARITEDENVPDDDEPDDTPGGDTPVTPPTERFPDQIISTPGPIGISFSPLDAGTSSDDTTLKILEKLYNGLDGGNKATYTSYSGCTMFPFTPKYTKDGEEYGNYSSLGEILNSAESIDDSYSLYISGLKPKADIRHLYCKRDDFDTVTGQLIYPYGTTPAKKIYEHATTENETFNMYCAMNGGSYDLFQGKNQTKITIVKDDYYFYKWSTKGPVETYSTRMWYENYGYNHKKNYFTSIHYIIDLRPVMDQRLNELCFESCGKYIQYSEENLDKLITLINERRAYIDEYFEEDYHPDIEDFAG